MSRAGVVEYTSTPERSQNSSSPENYPGVKVVRESFENSSMNGCNGTQPLSREVREERPESRQEEREPRQVQEPSSSSSSSLSLQEDSTQSVIKNTSNNYYEEQMPVVVHAESEPRVSMSYRQPPSLPPQDLYADYAGDADAAEYGGYNQPADYEPPDADNYPDRGPQTYYDQDEYVAEGRSNSNPQYGESYKRLPPAPDSNLNRKTQQRLGAQYKNRDFYNVYGDLNEYDYPPAEEYVKTQQQQKQQQQQQVQQQQQPQQTFQNYPSSQSLQSYHHGLQQENGEFIKPATPTTKTSRPTETTVLSVIKQLKNMWDLYRAFATAWNVLAERSQRREEEAQKQQQQQQQQEKPQKQPQQRINARKPKPNITTPSSVQRRNGTEKTRAKTTTKARTKLATTTTTVQSTSEVEPRSDAASAVVAKKGDVGGRQQQHESEREKRHTSEREKRQTSERQKMNDAAAMDEKDNDSSVAAATRAEGRYIKGDPLKGYYDFVITEGSYKFWAAFQVGTAILVIYSTFAAIYYSKVNPLVSDYDYTDYLGGARALSGSDQDFIDDEDDAAGDDDGDGDDDDDDDDAVGGASSKAGKKRRTTRWMDWVPKMGHSVKFILDAIDKLPVEQE